MKKILPIFLTFTVIFIFVGCNNTAESNGHITSETTAASKIAVAAWRKLTNDEEKIATLCDIAMDGDRGIASEFDAFEFNLGKTIAKGDSICEVCFKKVK